MSAVAVITAADAAIRVITAVNALMTATATSLAVLNAVGAKIKEAHDAGRTLTVEELEALMDEGDKFQAALLEQLRGAVAAND